MGYIQVVIIERLETNMAGQETLTSRDTGPSRGRVGGVKPTPETSAVNDARLAAEERERVAAYPPIRVPVEPYVPGYVSFGALSDRRWS